MRYRKQWMIFLALTLLIGVLAACGGAKEETQENPDQDFQYPEIEFSELDRSQLDGEKIVAVYEGGQVTGSQFAEYLAFRGFMNPDLDINGQESRQQLLKDYIFSQTFGQEAEVTEEIEEQANLIWQQLELVYNEETRQDGYEKLGISEEEVKDHLIAFLSAEAAAQSYFQSQITEEEITKRYQDPEVQEQITLADVRHILIKTHDFTEQGTLEEVRSEDEAKKLADDLYTQLQEGADFAELASQHSEDDGSKENGGLYAGVPVAQWVPEFKQAAIEQEINEIGQPVKTMYGFHIIRVEDRKVMSLEDVRTGILHELASQKLITYYEETLPELIKEINI